MEIAVRVTEATAAAAARRQAVSLASQLGFSERETGRIGIVATELATNLFKHAGGGELVAGPLRGPRPGLDLLALDKGSGIADLREAFRDGFSTAGSPGTGLGAVTRLSDFFDLYTLPGHGTAILARFWLPRTGSSGSPELAGLRIARRGETACGDDWDASQHGQRTQILVADGLGHGERAAEASTEAVATFQRHRGESPAAILEAIHLALRGTRGAAVALLEADRGDGLIRYAGLGNITAAVLAPGASRRLASRNGTAGHFAARIQEFVYPIPPEALLVLHSDGLATHWNVELYPGLTGRHPGVVAGVLYRDFNRGRDDSTVVAARLAGDRAR